MVVCIVALLETRVVLGALSSFSQNSVLHSRLDVRQILFKVCHTLSFALLLHRGSSFDSFLQSIVVVLSVLFSLRLCLKLLLVRLQLLFQNMLLDLIDMFKLVDSISLNVLLYSL